MVGRCGTPAAPLQQQTGEAAHSRCPRPGSTERQETGPGYKLKAHAFSRDILPPLRPQSPVLKAGLRPWGLSEVPSHHATVHTLICSLPSVDHKVQVSLPVGSLPVLPDCGSPRRGAGLAGGPRELGEGVFQGELSVRS